MSAAKHTPALWRVRTVRAGKARTSTRVWITNGAEREGWYPSEEKARAECDRRNAAIAKATGSAE